MDSACMAQYSCSSNMNSAMEDDGKDAQKLAFTLAALRRSDDDDDDPFLSSVVVPADVVADDRSLFVLAGVISVDDGLVHEFVEACWVRLSATSVSTAPTGSYTTPPYAHHRFWGCCLKAFPWSSGWLG